MNKNKIIELGCLAALTNLSGILGNPAICHADAINPLINIFTPDTAISSSVLTVLIILIEAILLRKWIKQVSFRISLSRSAIINVASSAAGSIAVLIFFRDKPSWEISGLFIPMFILTLATEAPLLKALYRDERLNWVSSAKISFGINLISYAFVFIAQFGLIFAYFGYAGIADKQTLKKWTDISLLNKESGYIYTIDYDSTGKYLKNILKKYDVEAKEWTTIDPKGERGIDPIVWDVRNGILACIIQTEDWENRPLSIFKTPSYAPIVQLSGKFREVRISPDLNKIAALEYVKETVAPKDEKNYFMLGSACGVKIYDIRSGRLLYEAPRLALAEGLCWDKDSKRIFFTSLRDGKLFENSSDNLPPHSFGRGYAKPGQCPIDIFAFDLRTNSVRAITEGRDPRMIPSSNEITFLKEKGMYESELWRFDLDTGKSSIDIKEVIGYHHDVSPTGLKYLIPVPHKRPLGNSSFLTVTSPTDLNHRHILQVSSHYDFRWEPRINE